MRRLACSSAVMLVTSISACIASPSADCTLRRPRPRAEAQGEASVSIAAAMLVSANRPENFSFLFKASPEWKLAGRIGASLVSMRPSCDPNPTGRKDGKDHSISEIR